MSSSSPAPMTPPKLLPSLLILVLSLAIAVAFAKAYHNAPTIVFDSALCGDIEPADTTDSAHASHHQEKSGPVYFVGGLWSPEHGLSPRLDLAMLAVAKDSGPIVCQSAVAVGDALAIIDRSPIAFEPTVSDAKPTLVLSIDYAGGISSLEYPAAGALQTYITGEKDNYKRIFIVEPLPGPDRDPEEDWTYLNFDGDEKIEFFTPKRKATAEQVAMTLYKALGGSTPGTADAPALIAQLGSADTSIAADARLKLTMVSPYTVIPALDKWVADDEQAGSRERRLYEALMVRRGLGVHADALIAEAVQADRTQLRTLAARAIADLADVTTDPIALLTPLAEDDAMAVRYEALVATRAMPGRRAAGVAELVEPYEMSDAMRSAYQVTITELLTYGEPVPADSKANRLRRMPIDELLKQERTALVCTILLERTDLPDDKIDEVLAQLAKPNGNGPLVALFNTLETMNPRTLARREVLLEKLVGWKTEELAAQTPRLTELALSNRPNKLQEAAAAAMMMSNDLKGVFAELGSSPMPYRGLAWIDDLSVRKQWSEPISLRILTNKSVPLQTTIAAIDAVRLLPEESISQAMIEGLLKLARGPALLEVRFAAIRAVNALPDSIKPDAPDLTLTVVTIAAVPRQMKYDKDSLTLPAGRPVQLTLVNPDNMEHNLVITLPGRAQEIGIAMSEDPSAAAALGYVPKDTDAVLHYTEMVPAGGSDTLRFIAPTKPGKYEYVCTFPGHYASMRGTLEVVAP